MLTWRHALAAPICVVALVNGAGRADATWASTSTGPGAARATTLAAPGSVTAVCGTGSNVVLSWPAQAPATSYRVERSVDGSGWTLVNDNSTSPYTDAVTGLVNVTVRWRVTSRRANWISPASPASNSRTVSGLGLCL